MEGTAKKAIQPNAILLQSQELQKYILETSVYPLEAAPLKELRNATASHPTAFFGTAPDAGQLIAMLMKVMNARKCIEIGVFTGYSLLLAALALPDDGQITAIDIEEESYKIGLPIIQKAGIKHKINFIKSQALQILDQLLQNNDNEGSIDFAFVDADKNNYWNYHERLMKLVRVGGIVVYDNTLWGGTVAMPQEAVLESKRGIRVCSIEFNKSIAADPRVEIAVVPVGDGITICRRIL